MASKVGICNIALGFLGIGDEIANFDTEKGAAPRALRRHYPETLKEALRDFTWPFAKKTAVLGLVAADPTEEWAFAYRYPVDCLYARRIPSGIRNETRDQRIAYELGADSQGQLVYTDQEDAQLEYTFLAEDPQRWPADFARAFAYLLSTAIGPSIMAGDPFNMIAKNLQLYDLEIRKARVNAANEQQRDEEPEADTIRGR